MKLTFIGAARTVTGSLHRIDCSGGVILVDCGMRQGSDAKGELGEGNFPFDPAEVNAVILTHAHIDHSGLLPLLVKKGFKGKIFATEATAKLCTIMLPDSAHIQEQDAEYQTRKNLRAGKPPVEPLYTMKDAQTALSMFAPLPYHKTVEILPGAKLNLVDAGHLLGSACAEVWITEADKTTKLVFSGDIGRDNRPIICDPEEIDSADIVVMEGTYGDREHDATTDDEKIEEFAGVLRAAIRRGGNIVIPGFAVGRTQELLFYINRLLRSGAVPGLERVPVYIDSPLGISATRIFEECAAGYYDKETRDFGGSPFEFDSLNVAQTADESKLINEDKRAHIIISSSGMCEAGRIRHHLKHNLYRADATVIFVGYQAEGTLGRLLLSGAKKVKLFGEEVRVNAAIESIEGFSGHAGKSELIKWLTDISDKPRKVFLVHGENDALISLSSALRARGYDVTIPASREEYEIEGDASIKARAPHAEPIAAVTPSRESIIRQTERIVAMLEGISGGNYGELKLEMLEADVRALADKWELLSRK